MALTSIAYISPIISFMGGEMKDLLNIRLVNRYWAESVEKYNTNIWCYVFTKYKERGIRNKIYNIIKRIELNWILYICIENNIIDANMFFLKQPNEYILYGTIQFNGGFFFREKKDHILNIATKFNNVSLVEYLLEKDVSMEALNNDGNTAIIIAAKKGHKECLSLLLEKGTNIEAKNKYGDAALIQAAKYGNKECLSLLLEKGANAETKNNDGDTALFFAGYHGYKECVSLLLEKMANVNAKNNNGDTALMWASCNRHKECLSLLKKNRCDMARI
jgi:hypothetical protein